MHYYSVIAHIDKINRIPILLDIRKSQQTFS